MASREQYFKQSPPSNNHLPLNNRPPLVQKKEIIAPGYYLRKYSTFVRAVTKILSSRVNATSRRRITGATF